MTQIAGFLDQRVRLYAAENAGDNGFDKVVYRFTGEWWGRVDATAATENIPSSPQAHREYRTQGAATFADYVPLPLNGVLKVGDDLWWVRGVVPNRLRRQQNASLEQIDPQYAVDLFEPDPDFSDGDQLIDPPIPSFSLAFSSAFSSPNVPSPSA